ncbi:ABC transporter permease subunit [Salipiger manganoxidans]|uniref:ABC transporter permease n=1 Tax=Salipiger marinus TaxID=555512 RepID=UPI000E918CBF|nr:ABC transporter permease subunit [Salipiger manganoxidans]MCD1619287.1 ABC transporter permease subunit [Salipiger manganoxidans]HBT00471.1 glycine/betaine ABC transporter permease [Citreicella sp.]
MLDPDQVYIPLASWIQIAIEWIADHFRPLFRSIRWPVDELLNAINGTLEVTPPLLLIALFGLLALWLAGRRTALFTVVSLVFILLLGIWYETLTTLSLIATAIVVCVVIGIPLGILCARSDRAWGILRPILDVMQTTPSFVYLIPVVMLFGVGTVPGAVAVIVVAVPPLIRFTNIGIRGVDQELIEAGIAFGATERQLLWEIQLPQALPTILGGLNQTVLLAMVMSVIVAMIGAEGLGLVVLQGLGRLDVGRAAVGGIGIVLMAIILDRLTQAVADRDPRARAGQSRISGAFARLFGGGHRRAEARLEASLDSKT